MLNETHNPVARSWLPSAQAEGCDFSIQNLPLGVFRRRGSDQSFRGGVAIGDQVLDFAALTRTPLLAGLAAEAACAAARPVLNDFLALGAPAWNALRMALFRALREDAGNAVAELLTACLVPQAEAEMAVPTRVGNYTDFYTSIHHARNVGRLLRPEDPLTPNFQWMPMAYHGRASSVVVSGTSFHRPRGQSMLPGNRAPTFAACRRLDYELELGFFIGPSNALGQPIALDQAESHIFGLCLLNDWSARDHQFWEMAPLGPFLGKNFCTSISPWIVSLEALAPYRTAFTRPAGDPQPLGYLDNAAHRASGGLDIQLEVWLQTARHRERRLAGDRLSATSFRHQYWTPAQMVTQHTVGGCNLQPGDLIGTGTVSGPSPEEAGALVELSLGGAREVKLPSTGENRHFLEDGDAVILRGWCHRLGSARIGFGVCQGEVMPSLS